MAQPAPGSGLAPAGELDVEVDELADRLERIVLCALAWGRLAQHVAQEGGVAGLLRGHVFDQAAVLDSETSIEKVLLAKDFETIVEKVQLDIFLVDAQSHGLVVKSLCTMYTGTVPLVPTPPAGMYGIGIGSVNLPLGL